MENRLIVISIIEELVKDNVTLHFLKNSLFYVWKCYEVLWSVEILRYLDSNLSHLLIFKILTLKCKFIWDSFSIAK